MSIVRKIELLFYELHYKFPRFKLWRICRALEIKPYPWQRDFALGKTEILQYPTGRRTGKTMAVMLRLLMEHPLSSDNTALQILLNDPDYCKAHYRMLLGYDNEYARQALRCYKAHIPVRMNLTTSYLHPSRPHNKSQ